MDGLAYTREGTGPPLLLLHGLGLSRATWNPVVGLLARRFDVLAVDLPGCGQSPPVPPGVEPHPAYLAARVAELLDTLGIDSPHVAGNSLGGWIAVELAGLRPVASLTLLAPAGLWQRGAPLYCRVSLRLTRYLCRHAPAALSFLARYRLGRLVVFAQSHGRPTRMTPEQARAEIRAVAEATGSEAALAATAHRHVEVGDIGSAPVTVAFGSRDRVLLRSQSRHLERLPAGTRSVVLPGCGHLPMADDPPAVVGLIAASATSAEAAVQRTADRAG
jgi:pimeloyl-ACP methyl ester carboxylesterase